MKTIEKVINTQSVKHSTINLAAKTLQSSSQQTNGSSPLFQDLESEYQQSVEETLARLIAGDEKLRELLVKTT